MATILERIRLLARTEVSELLENFEDPEKAVNEAIAEAMVTYTKLKGDSAEVFETEAKARERVASMTDEADRWHRVARKALAAGNEADARLALSRRQDLLDRLAGPQELYEQAQKVADQFRDRLAELEDGINRLQAKVALIKAKEATIRATEAAGSVADTPTNDTLQTLREREAQADWDLAEAEGLAQAQQVAATDPFEELEAQLARERVSGNGAGVDDALAALREELEAEDLEEEDDD